MFHFPSPSYDGQVITGPEGIRYAWSVSPARWVAIASFLSPVVPISFAWANPHTAGTIYRPITIGPLVISTHFAGSKGTAGTLPSQTIYVRFDQWHAGTNVAGGTIAITTAGDYVGNMYNPMVLQPGDVLHSWFILYDDTQLADVGVTLYAERV